MLTGREAVFEKAVGGMLLFLRHHEVCVIKVTVCSIIELPCKHLKVSFSETIALAAL